MDNLKVGHICKECEKKLPSAHNVLSKNQALELMEYIGPEDFEATDYLGKLYIDENHGYIVLGEKVDNEGHTRSRFVYDALKITHFDLQFCTVKKVDKVMRGYINMEISFSEPNITIRKKVIPSISVPYYIQDATHIAWDEPQELQDFKAVFYRMYHNIWEEEIKRREEEQKRFFEEHPHEDPDEPEKQLQLAKTLYMIDGDFTEEDIKKQRNKLLKVFHEDMGGNSAYYAQQILKYYKVLTEYLEAKAAEAE